MEIKKLITVEEHFMSKKVDEAVRKYLPAETELEKARDAFVRSFVGKEEITDLGEERIAFMDQCGISAQIVGYGNNSPMGLSKEQGAAELCRAANEELFEAGKRFPGRIYGYATIPVDDTEAALLEMEWAVRELGFVGVMLNGTFQGHFLDEERFFPIFQKAQELGVPVYLHPNNVSRELQEKYYMGSWSLPTANIFSGFGIGWHYETAVQLLRFILSGLFDKLPDLKMIAGHWGEMLPFYSERLTDSLKPQLTGLQHEISWYFIHHIYTNPSGMFYKNDFNFCLETMGRERILWAQDYPYGINDGRVRTFLEEFDTDQETKERIAYKNAEALFGI